MTPPPSAVSASASAEAFMVTTKTVFHITDKDQASGHGVPQIAYEDIGGLKEEIQKVREMIELPLRHPEIFEKLGIEAPKGVCCSMVLRARAKPYLQRQ